MSDQSKISGNTLLRVEGYTVRLVKKGDMYGRDHCLTHSEDDPLVEFYIVDDDDVFRSFISRYYLSTIMTRSGGINLCSNIYYTSDKTMIAVKQWLREQLDLTK
jgi:hypothetical protein